MVKYCSSPSVPPSRPANRPGTAPNSTAVSSTWSYSENVLDGMPLRPASRSVSQVWRRSWAVVAASSPALTRPAQ
jgi:hypothetical protein